MNTATEVCAVAFGEHDVPAAGDNPRLSDVGAKARIARDATGQKRVSHCGLDKGLPEDLGDMRAHVYGLYVVRHQKRSKPEKLWNVLVGMIKRIPRALRR